MNTSISKISPQLENLLNKFAKELVKDDHSFKYVVGNSTNDAFLLRLYLSFQKKSCEEEVVVSIDIQNQNDLIVINSDACADDGSFIVENIAVSIPANAEPIIFDAFLREWSITFEDFLINSSSKIKRAVEAM